MQGHLEGYVPRGGDYIIQWIVAGTAVVDPGLEAQSMTFNRPLLFPAHRTFQFAFTDYDQKLVHLNREHVARVAAERLPMEPGSLRFDHVRRPSEASVRLWHDTVSLVSRALKRAEPTPLLWSELTRMTAVAFLELYPPDAVPLPPALLHPSKARIRAAVEYIHENADIAITSTDVARAAGLRPRSLQDAFQRDLGIPPLAYLRQVRLDLVKAELGQLDPGIQGVADVASRWGFAHLGRFSAAYLERFGEHPRDTLRRGTVR